MRKRFVILVDSAGPEQHKAFKERLGVFRESGVGWWHWIANAWLIVDPHGSLTAEKLRDEVMQAYPDTNNLVTDVSITTWAGFGPAGGDKDMSTWLQEYWSGEESTKI